MKEGNLFCFAIYWDASNRILGLFGKLSKRRGALAWFHGIWTCGVKISEY
jgi:hypothetical protein